MSSQRRSSFHDACNSFHPVFDLFHLKGEYVINSLFEQKEGRELGSLAREKIFSPDL
jgi:hypothetical protein